MRVHKAGGGGGEINRGGSRERIEERPVRGGKRGTAPDSKSAVKGNGTGGAREPAVRRRRSL